MGCVAGVQVRSHLLDVFVTAVPAVHLMVVVFNCTQFVLADS